MSQHKEEAFAEVEKAIAEIVATPNFNLEFTHGYAMGIASAYWRCEVITFEELNDINKRICEAHISVLNKNHEVNQ